MRFELPAAVKSMLAQRARRLHHYIWHNVRNGWNRFPLETQTALRDRGWEPPRPAIGVTGAVERDNDSGEDFLYMHRQMIAHTNAALASAQDNFDYPEVTGWPTVPPPSDEEFPVPPPFGEGDGLKSEEFFFQQPDPATQRDGGLQYYDELLSNVDILRQITLGQLGAILEFTIHNWMHVRWASAPALQRPDVPPGAADTIDTRFDDPSYDYLGDTYSSHVNDHFWKLHGLVDGRIDLWATANEVEEIEWVGQWVGKMPPAPAVETEAADPLAGNVFRRIELLSLPEASSAPEALDAHHGHLAEMEDVVRLIQECGVFYYFYDPNRKLPEHSWN